MNKDNFLFMLKKYLIEIPENERNEILSDYEEHFVVGLEKGRNEEDIVKSLGSPNVIAKQLKATYYIDKAEDDKSTTNVLRAVFASVALGLFNIIFVLGPFLGLIGVLIGLYAVSIGFTISGLIIFISAFWDISVGSMISLGNVSQLSFLSIFSLGIGFAGLGVLIGIGDYYITLGFFKVMLKYLKANLKIIKGDK
ncbi:DUF1700 domain-containing protein [Clostridium sediminicola]|uniref:HAAS signaling domain-containing protein n=1 Tax=Clostridium sediminicola TaxID=3114879 RepID=UPI0031F23C95